MRVWETSGNLPNQMKREAQVALAHYQEWEILLVPGILIRTDVGICPEYGYDIIKLFSAGDMSLSGFGAYRDLLTVYSV